MKTSDKRAAKIIISAYVDGRLFETAKAYWNKKHLNRSLEIEDMLREYLKKKKLI